MCDICEVSHFTLISPLHHNQLWFCGWATKQEGVCNIARDSGPRETPVTGEGAGPPALLFKEMLRLIQLGNFWASSWKKYS